MFLIQKINTVAIQSICLTTKSAQNINAKRPTLVKLPSPNKSEFTSVTPSSSLPNTSLLFSLTLSIASNFTMTASILETILPMECSMRSTRRTNLEAKGYFMHHGY